MSVTATYYYLSKHSANYRMSSNKRPQRIFNFQALRCGAYRLAEPKNRVPYFKVTELFRGNFKTLYFSLSKQQ